MPDLKTSPAAEPHADPHAHHGHAAHDHSAHAYHGMHPGGGSAKPAAAGAADVEYTCPMHPEVRQIGPGHCPICGMALDPWWPRPSKARAPSCAT